jgi:hypothetical protein
VQRASRHYYARFPDQGLLGLAGESKQRSVEDAANPNKLAVVATNTIHSSRGKRHVSAQRVLEPRKRGRSGGGNPRSGERDIRAAIRIEVMYAGRGGIQEPNRGAD